MRASLPSSDFSCFLTDAAAVQVLIAGRDLVHLGWRLLHHPLYGNFRPRQQPYRSLLLASPARSPARAGVDGDSLHLVEEAAAVYAAAPGLRPADVPPALRRSCSLLDHELLRHTLELHDIRPATELVPAHRTHGAEPCKEASREA